MIKYTNEKFLFNGEIKNCADFDKFQNYEAKSYYEVVRVIDGIPLFLGDHLLRLQNTFSYEDAGVWISAEEIRTMIKTLLAVNKVENGNMRISFDIFQEKNKTTKSSIFCMVEGKYPEKEQYEKGVKLIFTNAERQRPEAKIYNKIFRQTTENLIETNNVYETVLVNRNNQITEGSRSNIFFVKDNCVYTPPVQQVLPGITRKKIIELCRELQIECVEKIIHKDKLDKFDAAFLTGTSPKILPVSSIETVDYKIPDPVIVRLSEAYEQMIADYLSKHKNR